MSEEGAASTLDLGLTARRDAGRLPAVLFVSESVQSKIVRVFGYPFRVGEEAADQNLGS